MAEDEVEGLANGVFATIGEGVFARARSLATSDVKVLMIWSMAVLKSFKKATMALAFQRIKGLSGDPKASLVTQSAARVAAGTPQATRAGSNCVRRDR